MKLKEKFRKTNLSTWINESDTEKLEQIADEYAIDFLKWYESLTDDFFEHTKAETYIDFLELYKKEKQL